MAPTTHPRRGLNDCAREAIAPDSLRQAAQQAIRRWPGTNTQQGRSEGCPSRETGGWRFAHKAGRNRMGGQSVHRRAILIHPRPM